MNKSIVKVDTTLFELIEDARQFATIALTEHGVSFCICYNDEPAARYAIFANDIAAWNRKTGIDCR